MKQKKLNWGWILNSLTLLLLGFAVLATSEFSIKSILAAVFFIGMGVFIFFEKRYALDMYIDWDDAYKKEMGNILYMS